MKSFYLSLRLAVVASAVALVLGAITMPATGARVGGLVPVAILVLPPTGGWGLAMRALRTLLASAGWDAVIETAKRKVFG